MDALRDQRPRIYAGLDLVFAVMYCTLVTAVIPNRHLGATVLLWALVATCAGMGLATFTRRPRGWWIAASLCVLQLVWVSVVLLLVALSAAYLAGIYGAYGKGASVLALVIAALVIELVALLPAFQLKYLMTDEGRAAFGRPPRRRR